MKTNSKEFIMCIISQPEGADCFVIGVSKTSKVTVIAKMITSVRLNDEMLQMCHQMHLMYVICQLRCDILNTRWKNRHERFRGASTT